jgi:hypothetical protein
MGNVGVSIHLVLGRCVQRQDLAGRVLMLVSPRHKRAHENVQRALDLVAEATELLETHPDSDLLAEVEADLRFTAAKMRARMDGQ